MGLKLYENVAIGNFLYGLGFAIAHRVKGSSFPSMVNLLQQTPADKHIGDMLMAFPGTLRIIEFKQKSNKDDKEPRRHHRLRTQLQYDERRREISRRVHWFVETAPSDDLFVSRIVPYLDAYPSDGQQHDFAAYINTTADAAVNGEPDISREELQSYLDFLATCHKSGAVGAGGLVVKMSSNGDLRYVALQSFTELRIEHFRVVESRLQQDMQLEQQLEKQLTQEKTKDLQHEPELDISQSKELGREMEW